LFSKAFHKYMIVPHSRPTIGEDDINAVTAVLQSGMISQGAVVDTFEKIFAEYNGMKGGVAVNSGTAGLHLALLSLGIGPGDRVMIPSYGCIALYHSLRYVGAVPVLVDSVKDRWEMDAQWAEDYLKKCSKDQRVKAIVAVHLFGKPLNMDDYTGLSRKYSIPIIEDCAQSVGAEYHGKKIGSFGEVSIFSFYATKVMTTGEGGMVLSNSKKILARIKDQREYDEKKDDRLRFNYKMTDFQAAMGISQLKKLPQFIEKRRSIAKEYLNHLQKLSLSLPEQSDHTKDIYYRFVVRMNKPDLFMEEMQKRRILCRRPVFMPIHRIIGHRVLPHSERIWKQAVSLPIYPSLKEDAVEKVIRCTKKILEERKSI
jgi:perosamine synthetase